MANYDALVIGGGPGGAAAALLLARAGWSVGVVERREFPRAKVCGEYLSATNWPLLGRLGLCAALWERSGPPVRAVGILSGNDFESAPIPLPFAHQAGSAVPRECLDTLLLERAAQAGARVYQPFHCRSFERIRQGYLVKAVDRTQGKTHEFSARVLVAAHGSWEPGSLPTQKYPASHGSDLLGFRASFSDSDLPEGLMPLVGFADGYGGLVRGCDGLVGFSCCVRRDRLVRLARSGGAATGDAVLAHAMKTTPALARFISPAKKRGSWLAAGPIRPGMRNVYQKGVFLVGNAAGEAHPAVAEGISMALQSAWLLAGCLTTHDACCYPAASNRAGEEYAIGWRRAFAPRIRAAAAIAHWAMRPRMLRASLPFVHAWPGLLTWGARASGKVSVVCR